MGADGQQFAIDSFFDYYFVVNESFFLLIETKYHWDFHFLIDLNLIISFVVL